jgi:leucyl aminopeptidase
MLAIMPEKYSVNPNGWLKCRPDHRSIEGTISMPVTLNVRRNKAAAADSSRRQGRPRSAALTDSARAWAQANGFNGEAGRVLLLPAADGSVAGALFGLGIETGGFAPLATGQLAPACFPQAPGVSPTRQPTPDNAVLGLMLGGYSFHRLWARARRATLRCLRRLASTWCA